MDELINKLLKYILMSLVTYLSLYFIPSQELKSKESLMITFIVGITFAILDRVLPSIKFTYDDSKTNNSKEKSN